MCKHEKAPARAAITLPVKSQYTQQDTAKIVVTCTAEAQPSMYCAWVHYINPGDATADTHSPSAPHKLSQCLSFDSICASQVTPEADALSCRCPAFCLHAWHQQCRRGYFCPEPLAVPTLLSKPSINFSLCSLGQQISMGSSWHVQI